MTAMTPGPHEPKIVCECLKITEAQILKAIRTRQIRTVQDITECTSAGDGCTACHPLLKEYLKRERAKSGSTSPLPPSARKDSSPTLSP